VVAKFKTKNYEPEAYTLYSNAAAQILADAAKPAAPTARRLPTS
jgi:branched-chain amino acid transport system substrate-binding protein